MSRFTDTTGNVLQASPDTDSVIRMHLDEYLEGYVNSLAAFFTSITLPDKNLLKLKFEELLLNIFTRPTHKEVAGYLASLNKSQRASLEQVMEENFAYNLKLEEYADLCNMSLSTFKRVFNNVYNCSPGKWLTIKRLDFAAHLLRTTDKSVNDISFQCGFEESSSFIRAFKQKHKSTPLQFRAAVS